MKRNLLFLSILLVLMFSFTFCKHGKKAAQWEPPKDQVAFVEYYITYDGKALSGNPQPGMRIDGPTYTFDRDLGEINSNMEQSFGKDTVSLIVGIGRIRRGTEGGGLSSRLVGVNRLPYQEGSLTIENLLSDRVVFSFDNEKIELTSGNEWQKMIEKVDTIPSPDGEIIIQRQITHQVSFQGFFMKDKVKVHSN